MLMTVIAAIVVTGLLFSGMAIGVIVANKPVKGSCGGLSALGLKGSCDVCGGNQSACDEENGRNSAQTRERAAELSRDANLRS